MDITTQIWNVSLYGKYLNTRKAAIFGIVQCGISDVRGCPILHLYPQ